MNTAAQLYQAVTGQPHPLTITEHPVRCPATAPAPLHPTQHTHECVHPGKWPEGVEGIPVHLCHCGATWSERAERRSVDPRLLAMADIVANLIEMPADQTDLFLASVSGLAAQIKGLADTEALTRAMDASTGETKTSNEEEQP